jgi:molybdate-binding protein
MKRILLVSEVASLGRAFERYVNAHKGTGRHVLLDLNICHSFLNHCCIIYN